VCLQLSVLAQMTAYGLTIETRPTMFPVQIPMASKLGAAGQLSTQIDTIEQTSEGEASWNGTHSVHNCSNLTDKRSSCGSSAP